MPKINLLHETLEELNLIGKTPNDIAWIGSNNGNYVCTWEEFKQLADREYEINYDSTGDAVPNVAIDLVIVFKDGSWLERWYEDGFEGWKYRKTPVKSKNTKKIKRIFTFEYGKKGYYYIETLNKNI